ncbi:MAG: PP2C family protein-serine/threonine phosphatase, partial [Candidatus Puniceispirillaceae bacterium]
MAYSLQGLLKKTPLSAKIVIILIVVSTLIGALGASIYVERKKTEVEEEIALELAQAGARIQKDLAETDRMTPAVIRKKLSFLSAFPYVKCAEFKMKGKPKGAWPIPLCGPMLKKLDTRPVITEVHGKNQLIFHVDRDFVANAIKTEQITFVLIMGTMLAVLSSILVGIMFIMVSMPFKTIAQNLAADEDGLVRPLSIVGGIEFRNFITAYNKLVDDVIAKTNEVTVWRTRIRNELKQADEVQTLLVPNEIRQSGIDARNIPLRELSGDFHEVFTDDDGCRTMILGDVAGKGIYAAMMAAQTLTAFRAAVHKDNLTDVLVTLNTLIEDRFPAGLFVALTLVRLPSDGKSAELFVAGNPEPIWISRHGAVETYPSLGPVIGVLPPMSYAELEPVIIDLTEGSLYIFTDGISDLIIGPERKGFADEAEMQSFLVEL